jgi:hypothetical protein
MNEHNNDIMGRRTFNKEVKNEDFDDVNYGSNVDLVENGDVDSRPSEYNYLEDNTSSYRDSEEKEASSSWIENIYESQNEVEIVDMIEYMQKENEQFAKRNKSIFMDAKISRNNRKHTLPPLPKRNSTFTP